MTRAVGDGPEPVASVGAAATFTGYAAIFDAPDRAGDVVRRGAFGAVGAVPLLWQHAGSPIGVARVCEDARGLWVEGTVADARVAALVAGGAVTGLSVGYRAIAVRLGVYRELLRVALVEVSLVAQPMQRLARVVGVDGGCNRRLHRER